MSNFKYPQYLTPNGFVRMERKPHLKPLTKKPDDSISSILKATEPQKSDTPKPSRIRLLAEKRVLAKRALERRNKGLSEDAAKILAEAIKTMLHS